MIRNELIYKCIKNYSNFILSEPQIHIRIKGLNFGVTPKQILVVEFFTTTLMVCKKLPGHDASELHSNVAVISKNNIKKLIESNIAKQE